MRYEYACYYKAAGSDREACYYAGADTAEERKVKMERDAVSLREQGYSAIRFETNIACSTCYGRGEVPRNVREARKPGWVRKMKPCPDCLSHPTATATEGRR